MQDTKKPILLFELGALQVYTFQTQEEIDKNMKHSDIYWQDKKTRNTYGPFPTIYDAVSHHVYLQAQAKENAAENVLFVDFNRRKRIINDQK